MKWTNGGGTVVIEPQDVLLVMKGHSRYMPDVGITQSSVSLIFTDS